MARKVLIGIDEVGRGCLAGPWTLEAFLKKGKVNLGGQKDSKNLYEKKSEEWLLKIQDQKFKKRNLAIALSSVGAPIIDKIGITAAARLAVGRCLRKLISKHEFRNSNFGFRILLDGSLYAPKNYLNQKTIIKGDEKVPLIAAASIAAKVWRDGKMRRLSKKFPEYDLEIHKGYGTLAHRQAIKKQGLSEIHRRSFCKKLI